MTDATSTVAASAVALPPGVDPLEWEQQRHALEQRFATPLDTAAAQVRQREQSLAEARAALDAAQHAAETARYRSDRRVFMRASVEEELEALERKTTEKKLRAGHRYLVARAVELAEAEMAEYLADTAADSAERERGVTACQQAVALAEQHLDAAEAVQARVRSAYDAAERGLALMLAKVAGATDA